MQKCQNYTSGVILLIVDLILIDFLHYSTGKISVYLSHILTRRIAIA